MSDEQNELLDVFRINLERGGTAYRKLGIAVLRRWVQALEAIEKRHKGDPVETPKVIEPLHGAPPTRGGTLFSALDGWKKAKQPTPTTALEFDHAVRRFTELHDDLRSPTITRRHDERVTGTPSGHTPHVAEVPSEWRAYRNSSSGSSRPPRSPDCFGSDRQQAARRRSSSRCMGARQRPWSPTIDPGLTPLRECA